MSSYYTKVLSFLDEHDLASVAAWLRDVEQGPAFAHWVGVLEWLTNISLVLTAFVVVRWGWDRLWLWRLDRQRPKPTGGVVLSEDAEARAPGVPLGLAGKWVKILAAMPQTDRGGSIDALGALVARRYDWAGSLFSLLRNAALIIGLLFTFIGLGLTLQQLSGALDLGDQNVTNLNEAVRKVRESLPGLSTAFGSSVCGVALSLLIWIADTAMQVLRNDIEAAHKAVSVKWLEASFSPATTESNFAQLVAELRTLNRQMVSAAETNKEANRDFKGALEHLTLASKSLMTSASESREAVVAIQDHGARLADNVETMRTATEALVTQFSTAAANLKEVADTHREVQLGQKATADSMATATAEVRQMLASESGRLSEVQASITAQLAGLDESVMTLHSATTAHSDQSQEMLAAMQSHLSELGTATQRFTETAGLLDGNARAVAQNTDTLATNLNVSGAHVAALAKAADRFSEAQQATRDAIDRSVLEQNQLIKKVDDTFINIPEMTQAITNVTAASTGALQSLSAALVGDDLKRYLQRLPELVNLSQTEAASRQTLIAAVAAFELATVSIADLDGHVRGVGRSLVTLGEVVSTQNSNLKSQVDDLIQGVSKAVKDGVAGPVGAVVKASMGPQGAAIQDLKGQVDALRNNTERLSDELHKGVQELGRLRADNRAWRGRARGPGSWFKRPQLGSD